MLVLTGGSPITLGEAENFVEAILWVGYPGQEGGRAVASVLFGDVAPSGKLPVSFPKSIDDLPPFNDYNMAGRTYRFSTKEPLYPFGFGLSYTTFQYSGLTGEIIHPVWTITICKFKSCKYRKCCCNRSGSVLYQRSGCISACSDPTADRIPAGVA